MLMRPTSLCGFPQLGVVQPPERLLDRALGDVRRDADLEHADGQAGVARLAQPRRQLRRQAQVQVEQAQGAGRAVHLEVLVVGDEQGRAVRARDREGVRLRARHTRAPRAATPVALPGEAWARR